MNRDAPDRPGAAGPDGGDPRRILIAGMGNVLRRDDGFGVAVANQLAGEAPLPEGVHVIEVGIGGIHLVQELMRGYEALIVLDAVERGSAPGTVHLLEASVEELSAWPENQRNDFLADMHYTTPSRAMILAKALTVLPRKVYILGCQPEEVDEPGIGLSDAVARAVPIALARLAALLRKLLE